MSTPRRRALLALLAVVVLVGAGCGASSSSGGAADQPTGTSTGDQTFTSHTYAYDVVLTKDWSPKYAITAWDGTSKFSLSSPAFDYYVDGSDRHLVVAAADAPEGTSLADWKGSLLAASPSICSHGTSVSETVLDHEAALEWTGTCASEGLVFIELGALHGSRGYVLMLVSPTKADRAANRRVFESARQAFAFTG